MSPNQFHGLSTQEATDRYKKYGSNKLPENPPPSDFEILLSQVRSPLVYILLSACGVTVFLREYADASVIGLAVLLNTVFGFVQERNANHALDALKKIILPKARVFRDGVQQEIASDTLVPGDLVLLNQGDKVPADGQIIEANRFYANESMLTGESVAVEKKENDWVFMGTIVSGGKAQFVVEKIGSHTEMGKIAKSVSRIGGDTPLSRQVSHFSKQLSLLLFVLVIIVFVAGLTLGETPIAIFKTSVALAVSGIPEGLLVALTVVLAIGMQRILKRKGLVRHLKSAETLGGVTTLCVDKTGTLTEGVMKVTYVLGDEQKLAEQVVAANDLDEPIVMAAFEWGKSKLADADSFRKVHSCIDSIPFDSNSRLFSCLSRGDSSHSVLYINGAPEEVLERCSVDGAVKSEVLAEIQKQSERGTRLLGFGRKNIEPDKTYLHTEDTHSGFEWVGLIGFFDPVREDVKESLEHICHAGIKLVVITGDYSATAIAVLKQLGLNLDGDDVVLGTEMHRMSEDEMRRRLSYHGHVKLFARTKPDQKLRIVETLQAYGEVVAMTGDGVNDAPALSTSDIGIVVGNASDVAKESSDLILLDSRFSTIVAAIEEGRGIFENIRKILLYILCDAYMEIILVLFTMLARLPLPITAAQILWINILADGLPHLALTVDPKSANLMNRKPRSPKEPLVAAWMIKMIAMVSTIGAVFSFGVFYATYLVTKDIDMSRSVTFATIGISSVICVFSIRTLRAPLWSQSLLNNKWLLVAVSAGLLLQILPFMFAPTREFFNIEPIGRYWLMPFLTAACLLASIEIFKKGLAKQLDGR